MSATAPSSRHLLRWIVVAIVAILVALAVALAIHIHALLQPQRFTTLLENDLTALGLELNMQAPAEPTLFPHPGVQLQGFSLSNIGSETPVLQARGATIVVPWGALLHGEVAIERVNVDAPRVDLGELEKLLARLPHHSGPPRLPSISTGIHLSRGTLTRDGSPLLFDFSLETGALTPGQVFQLDASARSASGHRFVATLGTVPSTAHDGVIDLKALRIALAQQNGTRLLLNGQGSWGGGENLSMQLDGTLQHRSLAPTSPATAGASAATNAATATPSPAAQTVTDRIALEVSPAHGATPMSVALKLDGEDAHADLRLQPTEFDSWWTRMLAVNPGQSSSPLPITGSVRVQQLDLGWIKATGLKIDAGPDLAPASGTSIAPAAASTATTH